MDTMPNKKFLKFILVCLSTLILQAQQMPIPIRSDFSTGLVKENGFYFSLKLYPNGKYDILYGKEIPPDMFHYYEFLRGNYTVENKKLILIDEYTKLKLEYQCVYDTVTLSSDYSNTTKTTITLTPIQTFHFLQNLVFTGSTMTYPDPTSPYVVSESFDCQTIDKFKQSNKSPKLDVGNYKSTDRNESIRLALKKNKRYNLYSSKFLFSSGKWRKKGDKLILQDSILDQQIYGIIGDNRILLDTGYELQYVKE